MVGEMHVVSVGEFPRQAPNAADRRAGARVL